ncbi:MAG: hypothetical protein O7F70_04165 [Gemmatimonadetes bacterium]|nr:hypothetical protein [Gemmatimonadota bacterium]
MHPTPPKLSLAGLALLAAFPTSTRAQIDLHPPGIAAAFVSTRTVSSLLYGVSAVDPVTFLGIPLVLVAVTAIASYVPARRAMRVDPVEALRDE